MVEIIALWIVCRNIGTIARARGVRARPFQVRAVVSWLIFEIAFGLIASLFGVEGALLYVIAFCGALVSLRFSFAAARNATAGSHDG